MKLAAGALPSGSKRARRAVDNFAPYQRNLSVSLSVYVSVGSMRENGHFPVGSMRGERWELCAPPALPRPLKADRRPALIEPHAVLGLVNPGIGIDAHR